MEKNYAQVFGDLDDLQYRLNCGSRLLLSVHDCVVYGEQSEESLLDALFGACMYIESLSKELAQLVEKLYDRTGNIDKTKEL